MVQSTTTPIALGSSDIGEVRTELRLRHFKRPQWRDDAKPPGHRQGLDDVSKEGETVKVIERVWTPERKVVPIYIKAQYQYSPCRNIWRRDQSGSCSRGLRSAAGSIRTRTLEPDEHVERASPQTQESRISCIALVLAVEAIVTWNDRAGIAVRKQLCIMLTKFRRRELAAE